jgi:hypothetical protein
LYSQTASSILGSALGWGFQSGRGCSCKVLGQTWTQGERRNTEDALFSANRSQNRYIATSDHVSSNWWRRWYCECEYRRITKSNRCVKEYIQKKDPTTL